MGIFPVSPDLCEVYWSTKYDINKPDATFDKLSPTINPLKCCSNLSCVLNFK